MPSTAPPLRLAAALLRALLPAAERDEVLGDLGDEYAHRRGTRGRVAAALWLWRQVLGSAPALLRRSWWRGWTGFEPAANRLLPGGPGHGKLDHGPAVRGAAPALAPDVYASRGADPRARRRRDRRHLQHRARAAARAAPL